MNNSKKWYESKAMWAGISLCILGIINYQQTKELTQAVELFLMGFAVMGIRTGSKKIS